MAVQEQDITACLSFHSFMALFYLYLCPFPFGFLTVRAGVWSRLLFFLSFSRPLLTASLPFFTTGKNFSGIILAKAFYTYIGLIAASFLDSEYYTEKMPFLQTIKKGLRLLCLTRT